jgi:hypothetical protein
MWSQFSQIASLGLGLFGHIQHHFNGTSSSGNLTRLTESQYAEFIPYIQFARAAYCAPSKISGWECGGKPFPSSSLCLRWLIELRKAACNAVPGFNPTLTDGDGNDLQYCEYRIMLTC